MYKKRLKQLERQVAKKRKKNPKVRNRYVALGARTDCHTLIDKFCKLGSVRYDVFSEVWREMKFGYIYLGRKSHEELKEFTEELMRIAKELWLNGESMCERIGGLYTLYGLYVKQPSDCLVKIRIASCEMERLLEFLTTVRLPYYHHANYFLNKLLYLAAFRFCIAQYTQGLEKNFRRYHELDRSLSEKPLVEFHKYGSRFQLNRLSESIKQYQESKDKLVLHCEANPFFPRCNIAMKLKEKLEKLMPLTEEPIDNTKLSIKDHDESKISRSSPSELNSVKSEDSSSCDNDEDQAARTRKSRKLRKHVQPSVTPILCEEEHTSWSAKRFSPLVTQKDSKTEDNIGNNDCGDSIDVDGDDDDDYDDNTSTKYQTAGKDEPEKQNMPLLNMPMLLEEISLFQKSSNII